MSDLLATAVVTGASRGIGKAIALKLAKEGLQVYLTYANKQAEAEKVVAEIQSFGGSAKAFRLNVGKPEEIKDFFKNEIAHKVLLAALVNNAGMVADGLLIRMKDEDLDIVLDINLKGPFFCLREAAKIMVKQRKGSIVNIVSVVGQSGNAGQCNYSSAKAGVIGLTKSAAKELGGRNITVNAVAPGFIETDMTSGLHEDVQKAYMQQIPLKKYGNVNDIAEAVAFLLSDKASYITGQVLAVNGGLYC